MMKVVRSGPLKMPYYSGVRGKLLGKFKTPDYRTEHIFINIKLKPLPGIIGAYSTNNVHNIHKIHGYKEYAIGEH